MKPIYKTSGPAAEYAKYGLNCWIGCTNDCEYCYGPGMARVSRKEWGIPRLRKDVLKYLDKQASQMIDFEGEVLLSFMTDPYCTPEIAATTKEALLILEKYRFKNVSILTKNPLAAYYHTDILKRNKWKLGSTIVFRNDSFRREWEPNAPDICLRYSGIKSAYDYGVYTWVSLEPVINPPEALRVIDDLKGYVDYWKIGKINHNKELEKAVDWAAFVRDVKRVLPPEKYYLKESLRRHE